MNQAKTEQQLESQIDVDKAWIFSPFAKGFPNYFIKHTKCSSDTCKKVQNVDNKEGCPVLWCMQEKIENGYKTMGEED